MIDIKPLPPEEAVQFFRSKGYAIGFSWRDIWKEEHALAFTVAKAMRIDILEDIRAAVDQAISKGIAYSEFKKNLEPILQAKGWWGRKKLRDPKTGRLVNAQLGSNRRLKIIFDTNTRMAYAAGRWQRIEAVAAQRPYLRYVGVLDDRIREQHRGWHGTVRLVGDGFWDSHYPPNGWRCRCTVEQLSQDDMDAFGYEVSPPPKIKHRLVKNRRNGRMMRVPEGISPGFDYNVGKARLRAYIPPPLDEGPLPVSFPAGVKLPPLPPARSLPASILIDPSTPDEEAVAQFLGSFSLSAGRSGAGPQEAFVFIDKAGEPLAIGQDLFRRSDGQLKVGKRGRKKYLMALALALQDPDEIWWHWERSRDGRALLRRRYLARFVFPPGGTPPAGPPGGGIIPGVTVFDWHKSGWRGVTIFQSEGENYLFNLRKGTLAYRRQK